MLLPLLVTMAALSPAGPAGGDPAAPVLALVKVSDQKCQRLASRLAACRAAGNDITSPDAALAVAQLFCRWSRYDAAHEPLRDPALRSMQYVSRMLDDQLRKADSVLAGRTRYPVIPRWRPGPVTWYDGVFWRGKQPVFLTGMNWLAGEADRDPEMVRRLGFNLSDGMFRAAVKSDGSFDDAAFRGGDGRYLDKMDGSGLLVDSLSGIDPPQSLLDATPGLAQIGFGNGVDYDIEHPAAVRYRNRIIDHMGPLYAAHPSFFGVDLANEPAFQGPSDLMFIHWRSWLRQKYGTLAALNAAWGAKLASFDEIRRFPSQPAVMYSPWDRGPVDFGKPGVRGMHYDWCAFNNERISGYFRSISDCIHARAPRAATHVKVMMGLYFTGSTESRGWKMELSYHTFGIDPEALAQSCSLLGCDVDLGDLSRTPEPNRRFGSVPYVMGWIDAGMAADFMKSLAPGKPFYNSELHICDENTQSPDPEGAAAHIATALWLAHLHGMAGNIAWYWGRELDGAPAGSDWFAGSMLQQPWMLQSYAQETLSLRRFVQPVMAFAREPRPVRLLYSEASAIQDVHYLDVLRDAYEALNFQGVSVGFVTERQLAAGGPPAGARLLIVPDAAYVQDSTVAALRTAARHGMAVGIIGKQSLSVEPTGGLRGDHRVPRAHLIPVGTPQDYHPRFDAWLRAAGVTPDLVALDSHSRPAWGIEVRTARAGGERLAYLVNLLRTPVRVKLRWRAPHAHLHDWRTGSIVANQVTLPPRRLVFGSY